MAQTSPNLSAVSGIGRVPPQAQEAEQSVLGGLLVDSRRWDEVAEAVRAEEAAHGLAGGEQAVDPKVARARTLTLDRGTLRIRAQAAHVVVGARTHLPGLLAKIMF